MVRRGWTPGLIATALAAAPVAVAAQDDLPTVEMVQPSTEAMAKWDAGDPAGALALVDPETAACVERAGGEAAELLAMASCTNLFLFAEQLLVETGDYAGALEIGEVVVNLSAAAFGAGHEFEAYARLYMGRSFGFLLRPEEALTATGKALEIARGIYDEGSPDLFMFLTAQAESLGQSEQLDAALAHYSEGWALPVEDEIRAYFGGAYGAILLRAGEARQASDVLRASLATLEPLLDPADPAIATLQLRIGTSEVALGNPEASLALFDHAMAALDGVAGWEAELAEAMRGKAGALIALQRHTDALALIERARPLHEQVFGSHGPTLDALAEMERKVRLDSTAERSADAIPAGADVWAAGAAQRFTQAEALLAPRLADCREAAKGGSLRLCTELISAMSTIKTGLGELDESERLAGEALAIAEAEYGEQSVPVGVALIARMRVYRAQGRSAEVVSDGERATAILEPLPQFFVHAALELIPAYINQTLLDAADALIDRTAALGASGDIATSLAINRATLLMARGDYDGAAVILQPLAAPDAGVPTTLRYSAMFALATALRNAFRLDEAIALLEPELPAIRALYGDGTSTAIALNIMGEIYATAGRYREATVLLEEAHALNLALLGEHSPLTGVTLINLGYSNLMRGELLAALNQFESAIDIVSAKGNTNLELMSKLLAAIGTTVQLLGLTEETIELARQSLDISERFYGAETTLAARARLNLASGLAAAGRAEEARAEYQAAFALAQKLGGRGRDSASVAATGLGNIAAAAGDANTARRWYATALETGSDVFAPLDPALVNLIARVGLFELREAARMPAARTYLREAGRRTQQRIGSYRDFDSAALREVRQYSPIFLRQVEAAWKLAAK